jgi:aspartate oxidase
MMPGWRREADVVIVGSGAAGITTALTTAARGLRVLMVTKDLAGGASPLAQGGLAAAIGPGDSPQAHARDTQVAGAGLCDRETVAALAAGSPAAIEWLVSRGARLERQDLRLEGGHSVKRIVHSGDDASGAEVHRALVAALLASTVEVLDSAFALDLVILGDGSAAGLTVLAGNSDYLGDYRREVHGSRPVGEERGAGLVLAPAVVIAAGGLGQAFATTSNPAGATGDGIALAARAGAVLRDLEFVQFHPTVLWSAGAVGQRPLITEALRGAGAVLRDLAGKPVMAGRHPLGDLAPRDIVAAAMHEVIADARAAHLWLDATALGRGVLEDGFPTVTAACRAQGVDPVTDYIPVAPGAHYSCGGIAADLRGRTSIPGLYAVGEAASTGVHGANRLASNSLVEAVIMGRNVGESISSGPACKASRMADQSWDGGRGERDRGEWVHEVLGAGVPDGNCDFFGEYRGEGHSYLSVGVGGEGYGGRGASRASRAALAAAMSRYAGVVRDREGLTELLRIAGTTAAPAGAGGPGRIREDLARAGGPGRIREDLAHAGGPGQEWADPPEALARAGAGLRRERLGSREALAGIGGEGTGAGIDVVEASNLRAVSMLIAAAALQRTESRGCHRRRDAPQTWARVRHTLMRWTPDGLAVNVR